MPANEPTLTSLNQKSTKDLSQEHGVYDAKTEESDVLDHQQRYDNSLQESEVAKADTDLEESPSNDKHFTKDFSRYSSSLRDNADGAPGADDDYGVYRDPRTPQVEVDVEEVADDEALSDDPEDINESEEI